ncbi:helix-turn-helix domain-containing protein [Methylobacterium sp. J-043]|nr:helix-turn-helix domain-containing protein [Methylobacterium sp. J-043]
MFVPLAYRIEDAAAAIGISRSTLFEHIKEGRIPSRKIGVSTVIRHCDLEAFLDAAPFSAATEDAYRRRKTETHGSEVSSRSANALRPS